MLTKHVQGFKSIVDSLDDSNTLFVLDVDRLDAQPLPDFHGFPVTTRMTVLVDGRSRTKHDSLAHRWEGFSHPKYRDVVKGGRTGIDRMTMGK